MNEQTNKLQRPVKSSEIDFIQIGKRLWCERKTIFWALGIGVVTGLLVAFVSPKEYKVTTTMLPQEESEGDLGNISSLASLAGFDLNLNSKSEISAVIYPQIVESAPFLLGILNARYTFEKVDHPVTMYDYYTKINKPGLGDMVRKYTIGLPALLRKSMQGKVTVPVTGEDQRRDNITYLTKDQDELMVDLRKRMVLTLNKKKGI
jgi:Chain length determinant protein.